MAKNYIDLTEIYNKNKGKWITLNNDLNKVLTSEDSAADAYNIALKKGYKKPILFRVPDQNLPYFGIGS